MGTENLTQILSLLALLGALAFLVESIIEVIVASWLPYVVKDAEPRAMVLKLVSSAVGVVLAIVFGVDLFAQVLLVFGITPAYSLVAAIVGQVLTGLLMGRGAQWFHDVGSTWLGLDGNYFSLTRRRL